MKVAIMQPYFFPYIGYWQLINAVDTFVIYDDVFYIKQGWINRNNFLINGEKKLYTIKLSGAASGRYINSIDVLDDFKKFCTMLKLNYSKAPYFYDIMNLVQRIIEFDEPNLSLFLANSIKSLSDFMGIKTKIIMSSTIEKNNELKGEEKVLQICEILGAVQYYNSIGGMSLYDEFKFLQKGIEIKFLEATLSPYEQINNKFVPGLSILDVMFFNDLSTIRKILEDYRLV